MIEHPLYNKAAAYCARAERCPTEVTAWLDAREVPKEEQEAILAELKRERFLDEARFIAAYAVDKLRFAERGPLRIRAELLARDLPEDLVERIVPQVMEENDYRTILKTLLRKKLIAVESNLPEVLQRNVIQWAFGKGFSIDDILATLQIITSEESL